MIDALRQALAVSVEGISFGDNIYGDEDFVARSIKDDFAGWYREEDLPKQIGFLLQHCAVAPPAEVLDAACGHGRHCDILSRQGYKVTGTDISAQLIAHLQAAYRGGITFERRSFAELDYRGAFDLAIVLGNSLSLIPREELPKALRRLNNCLKPDGSLFLELDNRDYVTKNELGQRVWSYNDDRWLTFSRHHYDADLRLQKTLDISIDVQSMNVTRFPLVKCLYNQDELSAALRRAGLTAVEWFGGWDGSAVSDESPSIIVVARRKLG